jgi:DNA ligase 1
MLIFNIFKALNSTNSNKDKEEILKKNKDNEELKTLLLINLDPYTLLQFNKMPCKFEELTSFDKFYEETNYKCFIQLCEDLNSRKVTGNDAKREVIDIFKRMLKDEFDLYSKILLKSSIGVGTKTVNKVWPNLVPNFDLMLAPNDQPDLTKLTYPCYSQTKLDGYRLIYRKGQFYSRSGKTLGNKNLPTYLKSLYSVEDYVLDGEIYDKSVGFNELQTILNSYEKPLPNSLKFVVFDCMTLKDWDTQTCKKPYSERLNLLRSVLNGEVADYQKVIDMSTDVVNSPAEAVELYKEHLKSGCEGSMLKDINGLYKWKRVSLRSGEMVKLKPFKSIDVPIIDYYEGKGKNTGLLGGVVVDLGTNTCEVGSGFTDEQRKEVWNNKSKYLGKIIEVKFLEFTEDKSLRHPIFIRFRTDKDD